MNASLEQRDALKRWLRARLTEGEGPKQEWLELLEATWAHLLAAPVHSLVDENAVTTLAQQLVDADLVTELSRPVVAGIGRAVIEELRADDRPIRRLVPEEAQARLDEAIGRPGLVHEDWVRAMFRGEAAEAVLNDALYRALHDFSTLLPRLMVRVSPMGRLGVLGSAGTFAEKLIEELERRIEPEIRSFLADRTERLMERAADFAISKIDDPDSIEFRRTLVRFVLSKSPAFFLEAVDDQLVADMGVFVELCGRHVADMPETRADIEKWISRAFEHTEGMTVAQALELEGSEVRLPFEALADATWPVFVSVLNSPYAERWTDALVDELIDEYECVTG